MGDSKGMKQITSNQRYGALNRRFNARARTLCTRGYRYLVLATSDAYKAPTTAVFVRASIAISASEVMHADRVAWVDTLARALRRPGMMLGA